MCLLVLLDFVLYDMHFSQLYVHLFSGRNAIAFVGVLQIYTGFVSSLLLLDFFISFVSCFQYHSDFTGFDPRGLKTIGDVGEERSISELQILPEALPGRCPVNRRR